MRAPPMPQPRTGRNMTATDKNCRSTEYFKGSELNAWIDCGGLEWNMIGSFVGDTTTKGQRAETNGKIGDYFMGDATVAYEQANKVIETAQGAYNKILQEFRSAIKNDLASIAASADKVQKETVKMANAYQNSMTTLNSPQMLSAIQNAERLAAALDAISKVQPNKIAFAVLNNTPIDAAKET